MRTRALFVSLALLAAAPVLAATRLDDSASPRARIDITPRWQYEDGDLAGTPRLHAMLAEAKNVEIRLNTSAYVGKRGRIYLVIPEFIAGLRSPDAMRVEWRTRGLFQPGTVLPGARALLYDGPISKPLTGDTLDFTIQFDSRFMAGGFRFDPTFEIDVLP
jgi:hypothetical protein